jgi:hypothetical protein
VLVTHDLRAVSAARLLLPGSVVTGRSSAVLWGVPAAERDDDVELTVPPGANVCRVPGITIRRRALEPAYVAVRRGTRTTTPEATAVDLARSGPLDDAVVLIDGLIATTVTDLRRVRAVAERATGRGCRQARAAAALADGLAASPPETRLRLVLHRSRLPRPVAQFVVRDGSGQIARVDFGWPEAAGGRGPPPAEPPHSSGLDRRIRDGGRHAPPRTHHRPHRCRARALSVGLWSSQTGGDDYNPTVDDEIRAPSPGPRRRPSAVRRWRRRPRRR